MTVTTVVLLVVFLFLSTLCPHMGWAFDVDREGFEMPAVGQ